MDPDLYFCSDAVHRHIKLPRHINDIIVVVSSTEGDFTLRLADDGLGYIDGVKEYIMLDSRKALRDLYHTGYRYLSVEYEE